MIVKNEARMIQECLRSARAVADQLIVVDTGSTDQTVTLALGEGAEVYHHPWRDNFSEARNHSLNYAQGSWILILDGDEVLDPSTAEQILQLDLGEGGPLAYQFEIVNFSTDRAIEEEAGIISQVRLFRNDPYHRYGGLVHNQIHHTETGLLLGGPQVTVRVLHYGYTPTVWSAQNKDDRISLHERSVAESPDDHFVRYNYGNHLKILKRYQEALDQFVLAIAPVEITGVIGVDEDLHDAPAELIWSLNSCFLGAFCASQIGEYDVALALTEEALSRAPALLDARVRRAEALIGLKRYAEAIDLLQVGLSMSHPQVVKGRALHYDAPYRLGRALFLSGQRGAAVAPFASLLPQCADITVLTHLCLCAAHLGLSPLWSYARRRGAELAPDDPDWAVVDRVIASAEERSLSTLKWLPIQVTSQGDTPAHVDSLHSWNDHLRCGWSALGLERAQYVSLIESSPDEHTPYLTLNVGSDYARLTLRQSQETLYSFPERYALIDRALPIESVAMLLAHIALISD